MPSGACKPRHRAISWLGPSKPSRSSSSASDSSKPARRGRSSNASVSSLSFTTMASLASVIMEASASLSPAASPPPSPWPLPAELRQESEPDESPQQVFPPSSPPPIIPAENDKNDTLPSRRNWALIAVRVSIFIIFLLVGTKKIAVGISLSAAAALIAETIIKRFFPLISSGEEKEKEKEKEEKEEGKKSDTEDDDCFELSCKWSPAAPPESALPPEIENTVDSAPLEEEKGAEEGRVRTAKRRQDGKTKKLLKKLARKSSAPLAVEQE